MTTRERREFWLGLFFVSPFLLGLILFTVGPMIASVYYSFCEYEVFTAPKWIGLQNFTEMWAQDPRYWNSIRNTAVFTFLSVPLVIVTGILLALLLNLKVGGMAFYRTIFFLPSIVPIVASSVLWLWILNPDYGLLNAVLRPLLLPFHLSPPGWLTDPNWAKPGLVLMSVWGAGHNMVLYLAGLQDVPRELHEAAEIDGAGPWARTVHITLPMLSPVVFFTFVMGLIGAFQFFTQAWVMTNGGPGESTMFYCLYLFNNAFLYFKMGYASAMAWILFFIIVGATILVFRFAGRKVYYAGQ